MNVKWIAILRLQIVRSSRINSIAEHSEADFSITFELETIFALLIQYQIRQGGA